MPKRTPSAADASPATVPLAVRPNPAVHIAVVHEDADLLVVEKPAGMVTQPGKGHASDSLLNGVFAKYGKLLQNLGIRRDYGLLHRLDKETSGLLVIAKMPSAYDQLRRDFESRLVDKEYFCITRGVPRPAQGVVQARLKELTLATGEYTSMKKVVISRQGQEALSSYRVAAQSATEPRSALVRVIIKTGRLHQIRAHMLFLDTPVHGDDLYTLPAAPSAAGKTPPPVAPRLCLHATRLGFKHPSTGKWINFNSPLPADLAAFARRLGVPVPAQ